MSYTTWTEITRRTKELELDELVDLDAEGGVNMVDDHPNIVVRIWKPEQPIIHVSVGPKTRECHLPHAWL